MTDLLDRPPRWVTVGILALMVLALVLFTWLMVALTGDPGDPLAWHGGRDS